MLSYPRQATPPTMQMVDPSQTPMEAILNRKQVKTCPCCPKDALGNERDLDPKEGFKEHFRRHHKKTHEHAGAVIRANFRLMHLDLDVLSPMMKVLLNWMGVAEMNAKLECFDQMGVQAVFEGLYHRCLKSDRNISVEKIICLEEENR